MRAQVSGQHDLIFAAANRYRLVEDKVPMIFSSEDVKRRFNKTLFIRMYDVAGRTNNYDSHYPRSSMIHVHYDKTGMWSMIPHCARRTRWALFEGQFLLPTTRHSPINYL